MSQPSLGIVALVAHARSVSSETRERFGDAATALIDDPRVIVLHTCHRVEIYAAHDPAEPGSPLQLPDLPDGGRRLADHDAIRHLFTVAAGLDSIVVGEDQILHQLRDCLSDRRLVALESVGDVCPRGGATWSAADVDGELLPVLDRLFQLALHVGRQTRAWRDGPPRSLADVALDRIAEATGDLRGRGILVVGAGRMSRLTALTAARREARVVVTNRTADRAAALAADVDGSTVEFGEVDAAQLAGVVIALAGRWTLAPAAERALVASGIPVVDLSSPPAVSPELWRDLGGRLTSVDDFARGPEDALRDRARRRIERLIDEADAEFGQWVTARHTVPAIRALIDQSERRRAAEIDRLLRRMPHLEPHERELVDQMSRRLVAGLLHAPLATLRDDQTGDGERAARELFGL